VSYSAAEVGHRNVDWAAKPGCRKSPGLWMNLHQPEGVARRAANEWFTARMCSRLHPNYHGVCRPQSVNWASEFRPGRAQVQARPRGLCGGISSAVAATCATELVTLDFWKLFDPFWMSAGKRISCWITALLIHSKCLQKSRKPRTKVGHDQH
jgi:hypothetical protein